MGEGFLHMFLSPMILLQTPIGNGYCLTYIKSDGGGVATSKCDAHFSTIVKFLSEKVARTKVCVLHLNE